MVDKFKKFRFFKIAVITTVVIYTMTVWHITHGDFTGLGIVPIYFGLILGTADTLMILILLRIDKFLRTKNILSLIYFISIRSYLLYYFIKPNYFPNIRNYVIVWGLLILVGIIHVFLNLNSSIAIKHVKKNK